MPESHCQKCHCQKYTHTKIGKGPCKCSHSKCDHYNSNCDILHPLKPSSGCKLCDCQGYEPSKFCECGHSIQDHCTEDYRNISNL